jgi:hypothetical protein
MLYCISNGFDWLGFATHQGMVIHFDLELLEADLRWRFEQIHNSYCAEGLKGSLENLHFVPLRGSAFGMNQLEACAEQLKNPHYSCASLDPIYRLLASKNESDPTAVAELLNKFLALGTSIRAAIALLQHFAKGDASVKEAQDRFSGSGVWARYPDALMTFTDLKPDNCFSCEFSVRSFEPIESFAVRWEFPRFRIDSELDPADLKAKGGRPKQSTAQQLAALLTSGEFLSYSDFSRRAQKLLNISVATFERRLREAKKENLVYQSVAENNAWALTSAYCQNNGA